MNESTSFGYQDDPAGPPQGPRPPGPTNPGQYRFSPDELRVLQECNRESFYQRSLPIGTAFGLGTFAAVQSGHLKPNARFGAFPKITLAVMVGYFVGKLSYQQACAEKLMALPGSYLGQLLRDRKDGRGARGGGGARSPVQPPSMFGAGAGDIYSDAGPGSSLDLDTDRPLFADDQYRPTDQQGPSSEHPPAAASPSLSYDELRRKNRGEYRDAKQDPYRVETGAPPPPPPITRRPPSPPPATNKYGDAVE